MLARLIVEKQMALLCTTPRIYLFYGGKVYARPTADGFVFLPWRKSRDERWPIWSLIDMDFCNHGPPLAKKFVTWPIQASSPNPVRYSALQKHYRAAVLGMPEWSKEDLMAGYVFTSSLPFLPFTFCSTAVVFHLVCSLVLDYRYNDFREKLRARLDLSTTDDVEFDAVLQVLRLEKEKANGSEDKMDVDVGKDQNAALGHAINTLLENAIDEFGSAPRDVYEGIFEILVAKLTHQEGLETLDFPALRKFVHGFIQEHTLDGTSDRIVAVYPKLLNSPSPKRDSWVIGFKSNRISQAAKRLYPEAEVEHLRDMFALFRKGLVSTSFAGWIFEGFVHHNFIHGWQLPSKPIPTLIPMLENSNGGKPPTFEEPAPPSTDTASVNPKREAADGTTDTPAIPHTPLRYKPSSWKMVTFTKPKDDYPMEVTLDPDTYYVPASFTNPLFDSFTIGYNDTTPGTYTIYIFQATVLEQDRGSSEGYTDIRKIVGRVEQLIEGNNRGAKVEVAFCLICPADSPANTWHMPVRENDHRVNAFCLRVPMKCSD